MNQASKRSSLGMLSLALLPSFAFSAAKTTEQKPNIIYILADDLGYGELGCYGQQQIETPNINKLAENGIKFTDHYSGAPVSAPSRCVLLTGKHMGHSFVRGNDEWNSRGDVWNYKAVIADPNLEGQFPLPESEITTAQMLKTQGYKTGVVGKWGLGGPLTNSTPLQKGFDFFFGYNCQRQAHTYYPIHLYKNDKRVYLDNDTVAPNTKLDKGADPLDPASYKKFNLKEYAGDLMFAELTEFVNVNKDEPFFMYWATPIPHAPIQAPQRWVDYYIKKFGDEKPYIGNKGYFPHRNPHAGYAAMISYLDEQVGLLVKQLKDLGIYENTLIIFTSDNGPTYNGGTDSPWFDSGGPFKSEMGWGKGFTHEGGMRVPMIAAWPNKIKPGQVSDHISAFWDVLPTICDITGMETPDYADGISFLPELLGKHQKKSKYLYWEFPEYGGQQAVRMGKWKAIRKDINKGNMKIELYNLDKDIQELNDVADQNPRIIKKVEKIFVEEHVASEHKLFRMEALGD